MKRQVLVLLLIGVMGFMLAMTLSSSVNDKGSPSEPTALAATNIYSTGFTANWNGAAGATGYRLDVYSGSVTDLINTGFEGSPNFPSGWTRFNSSISNSTAYAHTGSYCVLMNNPGGYFYTPSLSSPTTIRFWARSIVTNSVCTLKIQYSSNTTTWTDLASYSSNSSDTGDITTSWTQKTVASSLSGSFYIRWYMSERTFGGIFLDDIIISNGSYNYVYTNLNTGSLTHYDITGLIPSTDYKYVVRAVNDDGTSANSNVISLTTGTFDFPQNVPVPYQGSIISLTNGNANIGSGSIPVITNPSFTSSSSFILALLDFGPWGVNIETSSPWGAYYQNNQWHAVQNVDGLIVLSLQATKNLDVPIVLGNNDPTLPVELSSFTTGIDAYGFVQLNWVTQSETNAYGFYVLRASENQIGNAQIVSPLIGATNTSTQQLYQFTDESVWQSGVYYYWLQSCDLDGSSFFHGPCACFFDPDSEHQTPDIPFHEGISGVYPNPFNPSTTINYGISKPGSVELLIYNLKGQKVRSYQAYHSQPGEYTQVWDGLDSEGNICSSGIYNIVMSEGGRRYYRKVVLSK